MPDNATAEAHRALEVHMHQVQGKPPNDRDAWGRQFVKLWVSTLPEIQTLLQVQI